MRRILTFALLTTAVLTAIATASILAAGPAYAPLSQPSQGRGSGY